MHFTGITYLINNLAANTTYNVRVAAKNPAGLSDWTGPKSFTTGPKSPLGHAPSYAHRTCLINVTLSLMIPVFAIFISVVFSNFSKQTTIVCGDNRKT